MTEIEKGWGLPQAAMSFAALGTSCPNIISDSKKQLCLQKLDEGFSLSGEFSPDCLFEQTQSKPELLLAMVPIFYCTRA